MPNTASGTTKQAVFDFDKLNVANRSNNQTEFKFNMPNIESGTNSQTTLNFGELNTASNSGNQAGFKFNMPNTASGSANRPKFNPKFSGNVITLFGQTISASPKFTNKKNDENESKTLVSSEKQSGSSSSISDKPDSNKRTESTNPIVPNQASSNTLNDSKKEFSLVHHHKF
ncbi:hypothetical protein M9Y10_014107 [Tritrichomonas musculus]|uniref:Uncharacterized protein n=1 Tax=Tritrichomonas musculus TaxID=1915356 RepID=A0ABR2KYK9_9EUKA